jgi:hypothetical protein
MIQYRQNILDVKFRRAGPNTKNLRIIRRLAREARRLSVLRKRASRLEYAQPFC